VKATVVAFLFSLFLVGSLGAQQSDLEQSKRRLDEIRQERLDLERQQARLQGQVSDVGAALRNIERQRDATNRLVNGIESQISGLTSLMDHSAAELTLAQDNLADRKAVLQRRLADIYRRGPLYTFQVLLAAESFGDLLTRYKYLYLTSRQDR
jgi:peptidoglycan hydrolase CwlO-like protein